MVTALGEGARAEPEVVVGVARVAVTVSGVAPAVSVKVSVTVPATTFLQPAEALTVKFVATLVELTVCGEGSVAKALVGAVPAVDVTVTVLAVAPVANIIPTVTGVGPKTVSQARVIDVGLATNEAA
jgi:hypothetical protein